MQYCSKCFIVIVANFTVIIANGYTELFGRPEVILKVNSHKVKLIKKGFRNPHDMWAYCDQHLFWNWLFNLYLCFHSLNWYCWFDGNEVFCSFLLICPLPLLAFLFVLLFVLEFWLLWLLWFWDFQNIVWVSVVMWLGIIRHRQMPDIYMQFRYLSVTESAEWIWCMTNPVPSTFCWGWLFD